jgi:tetratricopeptide (TPR) repeat protein
MPMKKKTIAAAALAFSALVFISGLSAQTAPFPALEPDPKAYEFAGYGTYSWQDIGEIALWASAVGTTAGTTGTDNTAPQSALIRDAAAELLAMPDLPADPKARGEFVLTFVHQRFLKGYVEHQTRLDEIFRTGRYNCVSSAVLYAIFATAAGLDVRGVMTRDHAFITVNTGAELIDVETTNPMGFEPGNRREFHDGFGTVTGFAYVPARNYRDRTPISQLELVSLILSNRVAELESRNRYHEAVPLAINRAALLRDRGTNGSPDPVSSGFFVDPKRDLTDRLLNYGSSLIKSGQEARALEWAALAGGRYPYDETRWQEFTYAALNNLLVKFVRGKRTEDARASLEANAAILSRDNFDRLDAMVLDAELMQRSTAIQTSEEAEAVLLTIDNTRSRGVLTENRIKELRNFIILKEGERLSVSGGVRAAISYTEAAIARYGRDTKLENALRVYRSNLQAELHNTFADLYNRGDYDGAGRFIRTALEEFPGNRSLTQDLNLAEKALQKR